SFQDRPGGGIHSRPVLCHSTPRSLHKRSRASFTTIISLVPPPLSGCHLMLSSRNHVLTMPLTSTRERLSLLAACGVGPAASRRLSSSWTPCFRYGARSVTSRRSQRR